MNTYESIKQNKDQLVIEANKILLKYFTEKQISDQEWAADVLSSDDLKAHSELWSRILKMKGEMDRLFK